MGVDPGVETAHPAGPATDSGVNAADTFGVTDAPAGRGGTGGTGGRAGPAGLDPATAALLDLVNPLDRVEPPDEPRRSLFDATPAQGMTEGMTQGMEAREEPHAANPDAAGGGEGTGEPMVTLHGPVRDIQDVQDAQDLPDVADSTPADGSDFPDFQAIVRQLVLDRVRAHGEESPNSEVCGVLVGRIYQNDATGLVYVDDVIRGEHAAGRNSAVTFTSDTWAHIDREMDEKHPGKRIVGWYHTHPGFGIFLSEMDRFIQKHFFNAPWQTALVYDPHSRERGMFAWRGGQTRKVEFVVDDGSGPHDDHAMAAQAEQAAHAAAARAIADRAGRSSGGANDEPDESEESVSLSHNAAADLMARIDALERRQRWLLAGVAAMTLLAIAWPLVVAMGPPWLDKVIGPRPSPSVTVPSATEMNGLPPMPDLSTDPSGPRAGASPRDSASDSRAGDPSTPRANEPSRRSRGSQGSQGRPSTDRGGSRD